MRRGLILVPLLSILWGCGGDEAGASNDTQPGCSSAPHCASCESCYDACVCSGTSASACVSQCSTASGGAGGSGGGAGGAPATKTVSIETSPRTLAPGEEAFFCQTFANPFGGAVDVLQSESFMTPGSHHMFVFYEEGATDGPVHDCNGLEYKRTLHVAQTPQVLTKYPTGVGRHVEASSGLKVLAHYLNTGTQPLSAKITVVFQVSPAGTVQSQAAALFYNNMDVSVPPMAAGTAQKTCTLPWDVKLIDAVSHMHKWGVKFEAKTAAGTVIYAGTEWAEPQVKVFEPPLELPKGTDITFTCSYQNTTNGTLTFGESAAANEMCILNGTYFPAPNGKSIICM